MMNGLFTRKKKKMMNGLCTQHKGSISANTTLYSITENPTNSILSRTLQLDSFVGDKMSVGRS